MKVFRRSTINMAPPPEEKIIPPSTEVLLPAPEVHEMSRNNIKTELSRATTDFVIRLVKKYVEVTPGPVESDVDTAQVEPLVSSAFTSIVDWFEDRVEPTHEEHQFLHDLVLLKEAHDDMQRLAMATLSAQRAMQIISHNPNNPTANNLLKEFTDLTQTSSISDTTRQTIAREVILKPILNSVHSNNSEAVKKQYQFLDALNRQIDPLADVLDPEALCAKVTEQVVVSYLAAQDVNTQNDDLFNLDAVLCTAITKAHQGINSAKNAKILNHNPQNTIQITQIIFLCDYWLKQANRTYTKIVANEKDAEQDTVKSYILADIGRRLKEATDTHDTDSQSNIISEHEAAIVEYIVNDLTFKLPQFNMANIVDNIKMAATLSENIPTADAQDIHSNAEDQPEDAQVQPEFKPVIATHRSLGTRALLATGTAAAITLGVAAPAAATGNDAAPAEPSPNSNTLYVDKVPGGPSDINLDNGTVTMSVMSAESTAKELIKTLDIPVVEGDIYRSGLDAEGPFIVEQFAIHILKRLAQKYNMPESNFVTEEHVVALVAFAKGEGGDINNKSIFNLFNLGAQFSDSEQSVYGGDGGDGRQAYTGFDMGVEVNARQMAMGNQSRLGHILSDPNSTADDFMYALTHYELYEGNNFWAEASLGPVGGDRLGPEKYYQTRMNLVENVEDNYGDIAGLQIGTAEKEQQTGKKAINLI